MTKVFYLITLSHYKKINIFLTNIYVLRNICTKLKESLCDTQAKSMIHENTLHLRTGMFKGSHVDSQMITTLDERDKNR